MAFTVFRTKAYSPIYTLALAPIAIVVDTEVVVTTDENWGRDSHGRSKDNAAAQLNPVPPPARYSRPPQRSASATPYSQMSVPRSNYDPRRVCLNPFPELTLGKHKRTIGVYLAGALFALANWAFTDAAILSAHAKNPYETPPNNDPPVHVAFVDWIPGICSLLGYIVINLIDKDRVRGDEGFGDSRAVWRARLFLFIGFALIAGGLAGSVCVLVLKYVIPGYTEQFVYYGYANVSQNVCLMLSAIILWISQSTSSEYEYNLTL